MTIDHHQSDAYKGSVGPRDACVLRYVLQRQAESRPDKVFIRERDGSGITYAAFAADVERTAAGLAALGIRQDETVGVWLPNGIDMLRVWFAINWLGAVYVPVNTAYKGELLRHVLDSSAARLLVTCRDLSPRLAGLPLATLRTVVEFGASDVELPGIARIDAAVLEQGGEVPPLERPIEPWDTQSIIFTSGTTGPSKGVLSPYAQLWETSGERSFSMLDEHDCAIVFGPLFHIAGTIPVVAMLNRGGTIAFAEFSTERFWADVRALGATFAILLGVMCEFIAKIPPSADDRDHPLRKVMMIPRPDNAAAFASRFGVDFWTMYNMTELNVPLMSERNPAIAGTCGRARRGTELRIVDAFDRELPDGTVGELIVRCDSPWRLNAGYFRHPEATVQAWRNGWFHTGDAMWRDAAGNYFFADRMKDAIRRRGENISSFEVEKEILAHPDVRECAVVAVPALSEDDVLAVVCPVPGGRIDPGELLAFLVPRLAHFMLPRYIRIMDALPHTPTQKIEKYRLRQEGVTTETWDRERHDVRVRRDRIRVS
ncbi:AMP-dependent synthetase [Burkholderia lata]|uniref:AMP-binding protein n=1 Tax=Burkholderia lata (strain ATCC 17760 / DSM 23089 / LMG 22485 / NCIMB 9086 / R18194 / 383) TaxID=482957 RepID=UPI00145461BD|nr:AMP-binding protein [Burkholderia lata]VWB38440.1 AMP-dependent synthetase [Burkholderia lata]